MPGACTDGSLRPDRYPEKPGKKSLETIGCGRKCKFFNFLLQKIEIWPQNQIERIILGIKPTFFVWIPRIWKNKNITSSGRYHFFKVYFRFFGHIRLPVRSQTTLSTRTRHFPITCNKSFGSMSYLWPLTLRYDSHDLSVRRYDSVTFLDTPHNFFPKNI